MSATRARSVGSVLLCGLLAALGAGCASDSGGGSRSSGHDARCAEPVTAGADGAAIVGIVRAAASEFDLTSVTYRVVRGGDVLASGAHGDSMTGVPADPSMHLRIGNVAFAYMGMLLLLLDEAGTLHIDDPVSRWLPDLDVPNADQVTLEMLVRNTSGYPDYVGNDTFEDAFLADPFRAYAPQELIDLGFSVPPWYEPGASWNYSHTNYVILGAAMAAAGGAPLDELLLEHVIEPLGLSSTAPALTPAVPEPVLHSFTTERGVFEDATAWNPSWQTAPGGIVVSTICDLATSAAAVGRGELLDAESRERFLANSAAALNPPPADCPPGVCRQFDDRFGYGMGVILMNGWIVQTPLFGGTGVVHAYLPRAELAVAIAAVTGPGSTAGTNYAQQILQSIAAELTPDRIPTR